MKLTSITLLILFYSTNSLSAEQVFQLPSFSTLSLIRGMNVTVKCGNSNTLTINGTTKLVNNLTWNVNNNKLIINNTAYRENKFDLKPDKLNVTLTTTTPITDVEAQFGVAVDMMSCSYANDTLNLNGTMGAFYTVSGSVDTLNLTLNMGANFNRVNRALKINIANVDLSMGADAKVCGAHNVKGSVAMGAKIVVGENSNIDPLNLDIASVNSRQSCQL